MSADSRQEQPAPAGRLWFAADAARNAIHDLIHPQACFHDGRTYVVYQGQWYAPMITQWDHRSGRWGPVVRIGDNPLDRIARGDDHGAPAIVVDGEGFLHVFYGSHGTPQRHARSAAPGEIREWTHLPDLLDGMKVTYPFPMMLGHGKIVLFLRRGVWPNPWFEIHSSDNGRTWSGPRYIIDFLPEGVYAAFAPGADGRTVHCTFVHQDVVRKPEWQNRRHCFYMKRDVEGMWRDAEGEALEVPVTLERAKQRCMVVEMSPPRHGNTATIGVDAQDRPYLLILDGVAGDYRHRLACRRGGTWQITDITGTDWPFDNAGAIEVSEDGTVDVYLVSGGSGSTPNKRGGNIEQWRVKDGPEAQPQKVRDLITFSQTGRLHYAPRLVRDGRPEAKLVFCTHPSEAPTPTTRFEEKVLLWGDRGFLPREEAAG